MEARNALSKAENDLNEAELKRSPNRLLRRMQAKMDRDRMIRESKNLYARLKDLAGVCDEVITLRIELTSSERARVHEINILRARSKMLGDRMALNVIQAEADRYVAEANDVEANMKRVSEKLAAASVLRDRLKGLVAGR